LKFLRLLSRSTLPVFGMVILPQNLSNTTGQVLGWTLTA
jgi:hypothetical protein